MLDSLHHHTTTFQPDDGIPMAVHYCSWQKCESLHDFGPCMRNVYLIHYVVEGKGMFQINGKTYFLKKGDGFIIPPFISAYYKADKDEPWTYYWIGFSGRQAGSMVNRIKFSQDEAVFNYKDSGDLIAVLQPMADIYEGRYNAFAMLGYLYVFLSYITENDMQKDAVLLKLRDYINLNFMRPINMEKLCSKANLSRSQVFRLFKRCTGQSPQQYLLNFRLDRAQEMLSNSNRAIAQVASSCGFNDAAYFTKMFKVRTGTTPGKFRKTATRHSVSTQVKN